MVIEDLKHKELVGDTFSPTASMMTLKHFLADAVEQKSRVHQLDFIGALLQSKVKNRIFLKLDSRYAECFLSYSNYFGGALILMKSMYGMTNSGKVIC